MTMTDRDKRLLELRTSLIDNVCEPCAVTMVDEVYQTICTYTSKLQDDPEQMQVDTAEAYDRMIDAILSNIPKDLVDKAMKDYNPDDRMSELEIFIMELIDEEVNRNDTTTNL